MIDIDNDIDDDAHTSYKIVVIGSPHAEEVSNSLRFGTQMEAQLYALHLASRWRFVERTTFVPTTDQITVEWTNQRLVSVKPGDVH